LTLAAATAGIAGATIRLRGTIAGAFLAYHIPHVYFRIYEGGHSWSLWAEHAPAWIGGGLRFAAAPS